MMVPIFGRGWGKLAAPGVILALSADLAGCISTYTHADGPSGWSGPIRSPSPPISAVMGAAI
jgi:hypothetical protein